jgi:hypothetical protein
LNLDDTKYIFSKHHLFFFVFNRIQWKEICFGTRLTIFRLSNMSEHELLNNLQSTDFDEIIKNLQNINDKTYVQN